MKDAIGVFTNLNKVQFLCDYHCFHPLITLQVFDKITCSVLY